MMAGGKVVIDAAIVLVGIRLLTNTSGVVVEVLTGRAKVGQGKIAQEFRHGRRWGENVHSAISGNRFAAGAVGAARGRIEYHSSLGLHIPPLSRGYNQRLAARRCGSRAVR